MTKKSRLSGLVALTAAVALLATGCNSSSSTGAGSQGEGGTTKLEIMTGLAPDSALMAGLKEVTDAFKKENPGVEFTLAPGGPTYEQDMKVRMASGNLPDLWWTHGWSLLRYSKFLMPLQDEAWAADVNPALDAAMRGSKRELFAMPIDTNIAGMLYNKDVLAKAGVKPEDLKNWDDFDKAAKAVKDSGVTPIYASGKAQGPAGALVAWPAAGGFFTDQDNQDMKSGKFHPEEYREILEMVAKWRDAGYLNKDYVTATADDQAIALAQGKTGFLFRPNALGSDALTYKPDAKIGFMPVPSNDQKPYLIGGEYNAYGIWKDTENAEMAKKFLTYLAKPEIESKLAEATGSAAGLLTAKSSLGGLQDSYDEWVVAKKTPLKPYWDRVYTPNGYWNTMDTTADSVITNQASIDEAMAKLQSDYESLSTQAK